MLLYELCQLCIVRQAFVHFFVRWAVSVMEVHAIHPLYENFTIYKYENDTTNTSWSHIYISTKFIAFRYIFVNL